MEKADLGDSLHDSLWKLSRSPLRISLWDSLDAVLTDSMRESLNSLWNSLENLLGGSLQDSLRSSLQDEVNSKLLQKEKSYDN